LLLANGISVTLMSLSKGLAPAAAGILFSWSERHVTGLFLPGDQILFMMINMVSIIGLFLTFKPFFDMSSALKRSPLLAASPAMMASPSSLPQPPTLHLSRTTWGALPIQSLFPYLYFMIRDMKIAKQEQDIGFYAGFVGATYFLARTFSFVPWGISVDKYGRKPCIVISVLLVGLLGLLCGILGPIKAYATEVCRKEHQALGISLVTSSRAIALVVGPAIGGFLAQETLHFHDDENVEAICDLEVQVADSNLEGGNTKESSGTSTKNLLKNWQLMSAVILYSIFCLHDMAYVEATITTACNILQNTDVTQEQRGVANGISVTLMSLFKGVAPAAAGIVFSWAQKHMVGLFLPGDQILFQMINFVSIIGLLLTFKPFFNMSNALRRS
ncbi:Protein ZINC INDUCED FACILITATOR-LIKE 1, partial [Dichanthelium oligosanthes]